MHVYRLSLGGDTEEHNGHLAASSDCDSFPAAIGANWCLPTWGCFLHWACCPPPSAFPMPPCLSGRLTNLARHKWRRVRVPSLPTIFSPLLGNSYILEKKKCTHPFPIKSKRAEQSGRASPVEAPHTSPGEQRARVGCHGVLYASCSRPLMTLFRIGNI